MPAVPTPRRGIRLLVAALAVAVVAVLTLAPQRVVNPARGVFMGFVDAAVEPFAAWLPVLGADRVLNTAMFLPLGAAIALILSRRLWPLAILAGFALSATVEYAQASIPGRVPDPTDVLWNTVGGAAGVLLVTLTRYLFAGVRRLSRMRFRKAAR